MKVKSKSKKRESAERLVCVNWDKENPTLIKKQAAGHAVSRKVLTKDVYKLPAADIITEAISLLKKGYEVRLCGKASEAIRLYPCVEQDMETMFVAAQTMGKFRTSLSTKKVKLLRKGVEATTADMINLNRDQKEEIARVSPDCTVTCPNCGTTFRVGKKLK